MDNIDIENKIEKEDDGSLSFLGIGPNPDDNFFHCDLVKAKFLVDKEFWIIDYKDDIVTSKGEGRIVIMCKDDLGDSDDKAFKFITSSKNLRYVIEKVAELGKFPRRVTLRKTDNTYMFV